MSNCGIATDVSDDNHQAMILAKNMNIRDEFYCSEEPWQELYFQQKVILRKARLQGDAAETESCILIYPQERKLYKLSGGVDISSDLSIFSAGVNGVKNLTKLSS